MIVYFVSGTQRLTQQGTLMVTTPATARLGASIRSRRITLGMSQVELSEQLGISRSKISAMENGRFGSARLLFEVTEAIGLDIFMLPREDRNAREILQVQEHQQSSTKGTRLRRSTDG
ncbi:helix-turn-helix transcriptional regulator [Arthrobacter sp. H35-D1]|uniref:helix-turn-helix domain-containing protein n=1 Tax=Arthrobacter sp. H35-D1 TaxID=3046202 RepID=UPI0024BA6086|nr:helix-turn-helix transcriptional regulator [Arthrobacter sp. H35-D1]MDJ0312711.1 helix-turn-helix transcriptional regulator [Arthrobacter sp. H35-D1]